MTMREFLTGRQSELVNIGLTIGKVALLGYGLWKVGMSAITLNDLMGILGRKDPKVSRSLQDAIHTNPQHLGRILTVLKPDDIDYRTASKIADQVCYAYSKGKGKPHELLIWLLSRASSENQLNMDE